MQRRNDADADSGMIKGDQLTGMTHIMVKTAKKTNITNILNLF